MNRLLAAFVVVLSTYVAGSLAMLAWPAARKKIDGVTPTAVSALILASEFITGTLWTAAVLIQPTQTRNAVASAAVASVALLLAWLVVAATKGAAIEALVLNAAWSFTFAAALAASVEELRPLMIPHVVHRIAVDGAWSTYAYSTGQ